MLYLTQYRSWTCKNLTKYRDEKTSILVGHIVRSIDTNSDECLDIELICSHGIGIPSSGRVHNSGIPPGHCSAKTLCTQVARRWDKLKSESSNGRFKNFFAGHKVRRTLELQGIKTHGRNYRASLKAKWWDSCIYKELLIIFVRTVWDESSLGSFEGIVIKASA